MENSSQIIAAQSAPPTAKYRAQPLRLLAAVALAITCGLLARHIGPRGLTTAATLGQFGQLWLNALRMTLVPLVFCLMTKGVAGIARTASGGRLARIAFAVFLTLLLLSSVLGALIALGLLAAWPIAQFHTAATTASASTPSLLAEFVNLVPANPIAAAAEGAMAPLIVFAAVLGVAITRIEAKATALVLDFLNAIAAALLVVVGWVLRLAPAGIFFLLLATIANVGAEAAKGLFQYALFASIVPAIGILIAQLIGMLSRSGFAQAALPPQTLAATTQSSTACLPPLLEAAAKLHLPPAIISALVPLAVATFRFGNVIAGLGTAIVGARLFGIHPTAAQIAAAIGIGLLTNIGSVGVPGAAVLLAAWGPIYLALGAPLEALTLYIAVITVPDILITTCNVTADLAACSLIARLAGNAELAIMNPEVTRP